MATKTQLLNYITGETRVIRRKQLLYDDTKKLNGIKVNKKKTIMIDEIKSYSVKLAEVCLRGSTYCYFIFSMILQDKPQEYSICVKPNAAAKLYKSLRQSVINERTKEIKNLKFEQTKNLINYLQITYVDGTVQEKVTHTPMGSTNNYVLFKLDYSKYMILLFPVMLVAGLGYMFYTSELTLVQQEAARSILIMTFIIQMLFVIISLHFSIKPYKSAFKLIVSQRVIFPAYYIVCAITIMLNSILYLILWLKY